MVLPVRVHHQSRPVAIAKPPIWSDIRMVGPSRKAAASLCSATPVGELYCSSFFFSLSTFFHFLNHFLGRFDCLDDFGDGFWWVFWFMNDEDENVLVSTTVFLFSTVFLFWKHFLHYFDCSEDFENGFCWVFLIHEWWGWECVGGLAIRVVYDYAILLSMFQKTFFWNRESVIWKQRFGNIKTVLKNSNHVVSAMFSIYTPF